MASFEEQLTRLEAVVDRLERGDLTLDESVRLFEDGVRLSNACKGELDAAEGRIQVLLETPSGMKATPMELDGETGDADDEE